VLTMRAVTKRMIYRGMKQQLFMAWMRFQTMSGGARSQDWLAEAVSKELGLAPSDYFTQGSVSRWLKGTEPSLETIVALAKILDVDPGWLSFGSASQAPPPDDPMYRGMEKKR